MSQFTGCLLWPLFLLPALALWLAWFHKRHHKRLHTDYLTGVANRGFVFEKGIRMVDRALNTGSEFSLVLFDVDHFKKINDTVGHAAGDRALIEICDACSRVLNRGEILGRLGGEEFVVLLPEYDRDQALERAQELREVVSGAGFLHAGKHPVNFTASFGVATLDSSTDFQALVNRADEALYVAKNSGRNRVITASSTSERLSDGMVTVGSRKKPR